MTHCIIVGSGAGLGEAVALRFGSSGHRVSLIARNEMSLKEQTSRLACSGVTACYRVCDASNEPSLRITIKDLESEIGPCDTLIYNAAVLRPEHPLALNTDSLRAEFDVNLIGALSAVQSVAHGMIARRSGTILFTGGGLALEPYPEWTSLALGKAALRNLAFSLHKELAPLGIHVAVIAVCGIVSQNGAFDPGVIANEYFRLATAPNGVEDREFIFQPPGTDPYYNDPDRVHADTTLPPLHVRSSHE